MSPAWGSGTPCVGPGRGAAADGGGEAREGWAGLGWEGNRAELASEKVLWRCGPPACERGWALGGSGRAHCSLILPYCVFAFVSLVLLFPCLFVFFFFFFPFHLGNFSARIGRYRVCILIYSILSSAVSNTVM